MDGKMYPFTRSDAEWRQILTPEQYDVMRRHGTEAPGSCALRRLTQSMNSVPHNPERVVRWLSC
jgi:hypothetical protein